MAYSPSHYEALEDTLQDHEPTTRALAPATKKLLRIVAQAWESYMEFRKYPKSQYTAHLSNCGYAEITTFLTWLKDTRHMTRKSSMITMWNYFRIYIGKQCRPLTAEIR